MKVKSETRHLGTDGQWTIFVSWLNTDATSSVHYKAITTFHVTLNSTTDQLQTDTKDPSYRYAWKSPQVNFKRKWQYCST